ncbi:Carbon-nitrogen hydrolase [Sulfitobacter noctilucae]|uniref:carbon-nitrogen hydrolase family protein n=1 Tax=Sulfitobacter noctilucae TaxID=1342302 RepID=UPI000469C26D|nr:carbon-nitrogen hydrolase family protein [Sulfitobacter noctilucae]KIN65839.1 Carbon-nitrogen hydrolase [Sulfitobacter noctilucae]
MTPFAIAGVQMYVNALESNVDGMIHRLDILMARFPWTQMVLFSELAPFGPLDKFALPPENETIERFQAAAAKHRVWLIPGSMFLKDPKDGRVYNTSVVINPEGEVIRRYAKMFPFRPYEAGIAAGAEFCIFDVPDVGRFGLSICYDMWFPETTRQLTSQGVEVLLHPVLTGTTDRDAELAIARATAAQFQCYIIDVNGLGAGGVGKSCVVDPTSMVLHQSAGQEDMFPIEIDLSMVRRQREAGMKGLGQVLKSFRDRSTDFSVYDRNSGTDAFLHTLGPLEIPQQGNRAGLHVDVPAQRVPDAPAFKGQDATPGFAMNQPEFAPEPLPNPTAGTASEPEVAPTPADPSAAMPNPPVKPGILTGTEQSSSG